MTPFLADAIFWIAVVACAVAQIGILRATVATRGDSPADGPAAVASHRASTRAEEMLWAALPVIALAVVLVLTWRALHPAPLAGPALVPSSQGAGAAA